MFLPVSKTVIRRKADRGFKSLPLRLNQASAPGSPARVTRATSEPSFAILKTETVRPSEDRSKAISFPGGPHRVVVIVGRRAPEPTAVGPHHVDVTLAGAVAPERDLAPARR